jgi:predicted MFS family arabinose efflux permease
MRRLPKSRTTIGGPNPVAPKRPSVLLLAGAVLLWMVTQGAWSYAAVLGREHTGMSPAAVSAVLAASSVVALAGAVAGPVAARRLGRLAALTSFVVAEALGMAVLVVTHDRMVFMAAAIAWQACQLAVLVQILAAAAVVDPSGRWTASLGGAGALGNGVGPLAVGHLLSSAGADVLAVVLAAGTVVASLPLLRMTVTARKPVDAAAVVAGPDR